MKQKQPIQGSKTVEIMELVFWLPACNASAIQNPTSTQKLVETLELVWRGRK